MKPCVLLALALLALELSPFLMFARAYVVAGG